MVINKDKSKPVRHVIYTWRTGFTISVGHPVGPVVERSAGGLSI
jgi:hypothetical protein